MFLYSFRYLGAYPSYHVFRKASPWALRQFPTSNGIVRSLRSRFPFPSYVATVCRVIRVYPIRRTFWRVGLFLLVSKGFRLPSLQRGQGIVGLPFFVFQIVFLQLYVLYRVPGTPTSGATLPFWVSILFFVD